IPDPPFDAPGEYKLPHVTLKKLTGPARTADQVGEVDAILLSHDQHADNFDRSGKAYAMVAPRLFTTRAGAQRLGTSGGIGAVAKHKNHQAGRGDIANNRNSGPARAGRNRALIWRRDWLHGELFRQYAAALRHRRHGLIRWRGRGGAPLSSRRGPPLRRRGPDTRSVQ